MQNILETRGRSKYFCHMKIELLNKILMSLVHIVHYRGKPAEDHEPFIFQLLPAFVNKCKEVGISKDSWCRVEVCQNVVIVIIVHITEFLCIVQLLDIHPQDEDFDTFIDLKIFVSKLFQCLCTAQGTYSRALVILASH